MVIVASLNEVEVVLDLADPELTGVGVRTS
jgi:hypothetical protein